MADPGNWAQELIIKYTKNEWILPEFTVREVMGGRKFAQNVGA